MRGRRHARWKSGRTLAAIAIVIAAGGSAAIAGGGSQSEWPQLHRSAARTGFNPSEIRLSAGNVAGLTQAWSTAIGPTLARGPVVHRGLVIDGTDDGRLVAVRAADGARAWTSDPLGGGTVFFPPAATNGRLVLAYGSTVTGFSAASGRLLWRTRLGGDAGFSSPAVVGRTLFVGATDSRLYALDVRTGSVRWDVPVGAPVQSNVAVDRGRVVVSTGDGALVAVRASDGRRLWRVDAQTTTFGGGPAIDRGVVYLVGSSPAGARLGAFRLRDGTALWSTTFVDDIHGIPAVAGGRVFVGGDGTVRAVRATNGEQVWLTSTGGSEVGASIAVANDVAYLTTDSGQLMALDTGDGSVLLDADVSAGPFATLSSPAVARGSVYIAAGDGTFKAFRVPGP